MKYVKLKNSFQMFVLSPGCSELYRLKQVCTQKQPKCVFETFEMSTSFNSYGNLLSVYYNNDLPVLCFPSNKPRKVFVYYIRVHYFRKTGESRSKGALGNHLGNDSI